MIAKVVGALVVLFVIIWIFAAPAAHGHDVFTWITGLFAFFHALAGGR